MTPEWSVWFQVPAHRQGMRVTWFVGSQQRPYSFYRLYASTTRLFAQVRWSPGAGMPTVAGYTDLCMVDEAGPHPGIIPAVDLSELRIEGEDFYARAGPVIYDCDPDGVIRASHTLGGSSIPSKTARAARRSPVSRIPPARVINDSGRGVFHRTPIRRVLFCDARGRQSE